MGTVVCAAAVSHVLCPDDCGENMGPEMEREAFARWDARRRNELAGSLHLLISISGLGIH